MPLPYRKSPCGFGSAGISLDVPRVILVDPGTFANWLRSHGRLGGQDKVTRLIND
ncbi:hypothetical protein [Acidithiobacillus sp.]|jgi:hypothetical protein|uniref:hypothetical protein n=1 Tax=Acidithiobacillus sp. TaxID=1872118 RepID=UPI0025C3F5C4|nr:hypothetical protein [Acidithiobacillus sp.]